MNETKFINITHEDTSLHWCDKCGKYHVFALHDWKYDDRTKTWECLDEED